MKPLGYSLEEMTELLRIIDALDGDEPEADTSTVRADLDRFIDETVSRLEKLRAQVDMADEFLELLRNR